MITLSKIAKLANVSISTASKAFSMSPEVNEQTRDLIFNVAKELGCFKKFYNAKYPKLVIAVICPEFASLFYAKQLVAIEETLAAYNCRLCVTCNNFSSEESDALLSYYYDYSKVDGIIVMSDVKKLPEKCEVPIVFTWDYDEFDREINNNPFSKAIGYYFEKGIRDFGFIGEDLTKTKQKRFVNALLLKGIEPNEKYVSITSTRFEEGGYRAMEALFERNALPRVLFCAYDNIAIGAIRCIKDHGLTVPGDIAVIGCDNVREAEYLSPRLASIDLGAVERCKVAALNMINVLRGTEVEPIPNVEPEFILRESGIIE
jgi:LacI family transcriptional regulator